MFVTADGLVFACAQMGQFQWPAGCGRHRRRQVGPNTGYRAAAGQNSRVCFSRRFPHTVHHSRWLVVVMGLQCQRPASWVLGTQRADTRQRWLQGCRANKWCTSQQAAITQYSPQQTVLCLLGVMGTGLVLAMRAIDWCRHW